MPSPESIVIAHIGGEVADLDGKISPGIRASGIALPAATYRATIQAHPAMNGASTVQRVQIELDIVAETYAEARVLADAVAAACDHATVSGLQSLHVEGQSTDTALPDDGQGDAERIATITLVAWTATTATEE